MALVRVVERADGGVSVIRAVGEQGVELNAATVLARLEAGQAAQPPLAGRPFVDIEEGELPAGRSQRAQWRLVDGGINPGGRRPPRRSG